MTESVFTYPGLGRLLVNAIGTRDYPVIRGCILVILIGVLVNRGRCAYAYIDLAST